MTEKTCRSCNVTKPITEFPSNGFQPSGRPKYKPECGSCLNKTRKANHYSKLQEILSSLDRLVECELCGYKKNWSALCFHHLDESEKDFEINKAKTFSRERLIAEIEKCALLCHNCHMEVHYPQNEIVVDGN